MLLIRKGKLILLMIISYLATILTSVVAYLKFSDLGEVFIGENFLFYGILLSFSVAAIFAVFIIKSKNIEKELDNIIDSKAINLLSIPMVFKRLGSTGKRLLKLFVQIEEVSEKRKQRIIAQNNLLQELSKETNRPIAIIDLRRKIKYISKGMLDKNKLTKAEILEKDINVIMGRVQIKSILSGLEKKHIALKIKNRGKTYKWVPVYNGNNEISYLMLIQE